MTGDDRQRHGLDGERLAERFLRKAGYRVLARRYRCRRGEIDLIVADGPVIVFVEVRLRTARATYDPAVTVNARKQAALCRAARQWLRERGAPVDSTRFDIVAIRRQARGGCRIRHLRDAFRPSRRDAGW